MRAPASKSRSIWPTAYSAVLPPNFVGFSRNDFREVAYRLVQLVLGRFRDRGQRDAEKRADIVAADVDRHQVARAERERRVGGEEAIHLLRQVPGRYRGMNYKGVRRARGRRRGRAAHGHVDDLSAANSELRGERYRVHAPKRETDRSPVGQRRSERVRGGLVREREVGVAVAEHDEPLIFLLRRRTRHEAGNGKHQGGSGDGSACPRTRPRVTQHGTPPYATAIQAFPGAWKPCPSRARLLLPRPRLLRRPRTVGRGRSDDFHRPLRSGHPIGGLSSGSDTRELWLKGP